MFKKLKKIIRMDKVIFFLFSNQYFKNTGYKTLDIWKMIFGTRADSSDTEEHVFSIKRYFSILFN